MGVVTRGEREVSLRFETFPSKLKEKLERRIRELTELLQQRVEAAAPKKTGRLRSEIKANVYTGDSGDRVAGYVSVFAGSLQKEYAKAATLEYGSDKPRRLAARLGAPRRRLERRLSKPVHIEAFRYLRGQLEAMRPEIETALNEVVAETIAEGER